MAITLSGSYFQTLMNDADTSAATWESVIDSAVNAINSRANANLPNMTGTAGSKTLSVTSKQAGSIEFVVRVIYATYLKNAGNQTVGVGGLSLQVTDLMSSPAVLRAVDEAAARLDEKEWERAFL